MIETEVSIPVYLKEIELIKVNNKAEHKYYIYQYIYKPDSFIVYIGEQREEGIVFRQTTLERVTVNIERFLTPRPAVCH